MYREILKISAKVDNIQQQMNTLQQTMINLNVDSNNNGKNVPIDISIFPLKTIEDVENLERHLGDADGRQGLACFFYLHFNFFLNIWNILIHKIFLACLVFIPFKYKIG